MIYKIQTRDKNTGKEEVRYEKEEFIHSIILDSSHPRSILLNIKISTKNGASSVYLMVLNVSTLKYYF